VFGPNQEEGCDGCSMFVDHLTHLAHLNAPDTTFMSPSEATRVACIALTSLTGWAWRRLAQSGASSTALRWADRRNGRTRVAHLAGLVTAAVAGDAP
jgi:predicted dithiol-disulfide oxidoreductase (DUF899 family)